MPIHRNQILSDSLDVKTVAGTIAPGAFVVLVSGDDLKRTSARIQVLHCHLVVGFASPNAVVPELRVQRNTGTFTTVLRPDLLKGELNHGPLLFSRADFDDSVDAGLRIFGADNDPGGTTGGTGSYSISFILV